MPDNSLSDRRLFVFGSFTLDAAQRLLFQGSEVVPLEPKVFETLLALVEQAGRALSKDELLTRVWPDAFVEEGSLTRNISTLRKALASDGHPQGYIDTLPRRGYRFQPVVERVSATPGPFATASPATPMPSRAEAIATVVPEVSVRPAPDAAPAVVPEPTPAPAVVHAARSADAPRFRWLPTAVATVAALLVVAAAGAWWRSGDKPERITSIAVLPLQNLSGDPSQEFFSDGMTEALIARLAQVSDLRVTSRTSVMRFKGASAPVPDIGRQLGVDAVVEGSVQRDGSRVRVTVQLIHAATDSHVWAKEFDGTMHDVLDLQRRIALAIAGDISSTITPVSPTGAPERRLAAEAVDAYLLGRYLFWKTDLESKRRAITELRKATTLEPSYVDAQAALAMALIGEGSRGFTELTGEALEVARTAVALDDHSADAHAALAAASFEAWDWEGTQREFERALALYPNSEDACVSYGLALSAFGRHDEAVAWAGRFAARNPVSAALHINYAVVLINARRYAEAERHLKLALELEPLSFGAPIALAQVYALTGRPEQALALMSVPPFAGSSVHAGMYAANGRRDEALAIVKTLERNPAPADLYSIANVYLRLGDTDRGFEWMRRAVGKRVGYVRWMNVHPAFDPWRSDPRFNALVEQLQLP
jgi:TolB-like protein/DNA-binding winged helix-turn-helix (wHTH) protein/Tfp pilus assembly protein PilF